MEQFPQTIALFMLLSVNCLGRPDVLDCDKHVALSFPSGSIRVSPKDGEGVPMGASNGLSQAKVDWHHALCLVFGHLKLLIHVL